MKSSWITRGMTAILIVLLIGTALPEKSQAAAPVNTLVGALKAEIQSAVVEKTPDGSLIAAVVRLNNIGSKVVRVPDYEVRAVTTNKLQYILQPSQDNPKAVQPKETVELKYLMAVRRFDAFKLDRLIWIKTDAYVYPKKELLMLSLPVPPFQPVGKSWGQSFTVPTTSASLVYTPFQMYKQNTPEGTTVIVGFQVENAGKLEETVPNFRLDGKTAAKTYAGQRIDKGTLSLKPGEKQRFYFSIPVNNDTRLSSLQVLTTETFAAANRPALSYSLNQVEISLPSVMDGTASYDQLKTYSEDSPIELDSYNQLFNTDLEISMVNLQVFQTEGNAFQSAVAKFKLFNHGNLPSPIPKFGVQLLSEGGRYYQGTLLAGDIGSLAPNLGYVVSYTFQLPMTEKGGSYGMVLLDATSQAPYSVPIASFKANVSGGKDTEQTELYPFRVKLNDWMVSLDGVEVNLDVDREENVLADAASAVIKIELTASDGELLGSERVPLVGGERPASGWMKLAIGSSTNKYPDTLRMYEVVDTPFGEVKRLLKTME